MKNEFKLEKIGDVHSTYPYLCVYLCGEDEPFMEIAVSEEKQLIYTFYARNSAIALSVDDIESIMQQGISFLPEALENGG